MSDNNVGYFSRSNEILNDFISKLAQQQPQEPEVNKDEVLKNFEAFEAAVQNDPLMRRAFIALKKRFAEDPEYRAKTDPNFVAGVMLLNIPSEQK